MGPNLFCKEKNRVVMLEKDLEAPFQMPVLGISKRQLCEDGGKLFYLQTFLCGK
jgi:hypothetical protein